MKDKILIIPKIYFSGGTKQYLLCLLEYLSAKNTDVTVLLSKTYIDENLINTIKGYNYKFHLINEYSSVENLFKRSGLFSLYRTILNFKKYFLIFYYKKKYSADKIIFSEWNAVWDFIFLLLPGKKYFIVHSYPLRKVPKVVSNFLNFYFQNNNIRIATVSNFSAKRINSYWFGGKEKSIVIPNYSKFENIDANARSSYKSDTFTILTTGHLVKYKNPGFWLEVANTVIGKNPDKKIKFIWIGEGELYPHFKQYETADINFIGNSNRVDKYLTEGSLYFQPSLLESQGMAVLEAMNFGLPCVVSNAGGMPESVKDGYNGYVFSLDDDAESVASKIGTILFNEDLWHYFSRNGINFYNDNFSKKNWYKQMDGYLKE